MADVDLSALSGFLTMIMVLAARFMFWDGQTELRMAWEAVRMTLGRNEMVPEHEAAFAERLVSSRKTVFKGISFFWAVCSDLLLCFWPFTGEDVFLTPHFWATILASSMLRYCAAPAVHLEERHINRMIVLLNLICLAIGSGVPRQLLPALAAARFVIGAFSQEPRLALWVNAVLSPLFLMVTWAKEPNDDLTSFFNCLLTELFILVQLALILIKLDSNLQHELEATIKLEARLCDVEVSGLAARKLVAVTCDAFVRLTSSLTIVEPQQCLVDMLGAKPDLLEGRSFLDFVSPSDKVRLRDQIDLKMSQSESPASSCSLRLLDAVGTALDTRIYHVYVRNPVTDVAEHLIGITEANQDRSSRVNSEYSGSRHDLASADMRHLLGYGVNEGGHLPSQSSGRSRSQQSRHSRTETSINENDWAPLFGLEAVGLVLDAGAVHDGFTVKSAKFQFRREMGEELHGLLPNLLEWILPKYRNKVFCWVQDHANAYMQGFQCSRPILNRVQVLQPGTDDQCLMVGEFEMVQMTNSLDPEDEMTHVRSERSEGVSSQATRSRDDEEKDVFMHLEMRRFFFR